MSQQPDCVFVYGTLKRGYRYHHYLEGKQFLGVAQTCERYALFQGSDPWPLMVKQPAAYPVQGEVFAVTAVDMVRLDQLEECPDLYTREAIAVQFSNGTQMTAWVYFAVEAEGCLLGEGFFPLPD